MSKNGPGAHEKNGSRPPAASCPDDRQRAELKAYLDGELASPRRWLLRRHLVRCAACREEISELKRLGEDMKDLDRAVPRPELRARILANLPPPPTHYAPTPRTIGRAVPRLALGGALVVLGLGAAFAMTHLLGHSGAIKSADGTQTVVALPAPDTRYVPNSTPPFIPRSAGAVPPGIENHPRYRSVDPFDPDHLKDKPSAPLPHKSAPTTPEMPRRPDAHLQQPKPQESVPVPTPLDLKEPVRLALVVNDTDSLYQHIQARVEKLGGRIVSLRSDSPDAPRDGNPIPKKEGASVGPAPTPEPQHGNVLTLSAPAAHARALLGALKQLGTVMPAPAVPAVSTDHSPMPRPIRPPFGSIQDGGPQSRPEHSDSMDKEFPSKTRPTTSDKAKADGSVTIILMLYRRLNPSH